MDSSRFFPAIVPALAGVLFAVLLLFGFASVDPLREATDQELLDWWNDPGNQRDMAMSMYFVLGSAAAFVVFLVGLRTRIAEAEGGSSPLATLVFALGIVFVCSLAAGDALRGAIGQSVRFEGESLPSADVLRTVTAMSFTLVGVVAFGAAGLMLAAASYAILRTHAAAAWLGWTGVAVAVLVLVAVPLLIGPWTSPLIQLWTVAACVELWRTRNRQPAAERTMLSVSAA